MDQLALKDRALGVAAESVTIADARLPDRPLIYGNEGFERITGYPRAEVLGRNCRFLQGPRTDPGAVSQIRAAVAEQRECVVEILNYRATASSNVGRGGRRHLPLAFAEYGAIRAASVLKTSLVLRSVRRQSWRISLKDETTREGPAEWRATRDEECEPPLSARGIKVSEVGHPSFRLRFSELTTVRKSPGWPVGRKG